jgi:nicotinamide-nucleotide amidase
MQHSASDAFYCLITGHPIHGPGSGGRMKAVVMSVGAELLGGFLTDTNATYLAQDMSAAGIDLVGVMQVGDDRDRIAQVIQRAAEDAELIVITGGVGPTEDDLTREAIAHYVGEEVHVDPEQLKLVERFFASRGIPMPERNAKQAWLIPSSEALPNPVGTAPGWFVRHDGHIIVSMPGVPREMHRMWREQVLPRLQDRLGTTSIVSTTVKTIGIGESAAEDMVKDIIHRGHPVVATYAKNDGVHIRITASDESQEVAERLVQQTEQEIREIFGPHAYGDLDTRLGQAILAQCKKRGAAIRVVEAGSAGRILNMLAEEHELAGWFSGGQVGQFVDVANRCGIDPDREDSAMAVARGLVNQDNANETTALIAIAVRVAESVDNDRFAGEIAFCLSVNGNVHERTHKVEASYSEIRRRAALWASEFLHVTLASE